MKKPGWPQIAHQHIGGRAAETAITQVEMETAKNIALS